MTTPKKIIVIGAGPGGLTAAMLLSRRGFQVEVYEKQPQVGGRNSHIEMNGFRFDVGPTFLMLKPVLDEVFQEAGKKSDDYLKFIKLDPMYRLQFSSFAFEPTADLVHMKQKIKDQFPGLEAGFDRYVQKESLRFEKMYPCLQKHYSTLSTMVSKELLAALPYLSLGKSVFDILLGYFKKEDLALCFSFQTKYLGMSAWECPAAFSMLSYIEYAYGVYHTLGGLSEISTQMAKVAQENGARIHLNTPVRRIMIQNRCAQGVELENGEKIEADEVIVNADFGHAMTHLVDPENLRKYTPEKLKTKRLSCSTFMLYLGMDRSYDLPHHTIVFARDYRGNVLDIFNRQRLSEDISFYVRNASPSDPTLAPPGKSGLYVLVPVPNRRAPIDWSRECAPFRERVLESIQKRLGLNDLKEKILVEKVITPDEWQNEYFVYEGATFNLAHNISQMIYLRPRNKFEEFDRCYLVGGGTHPGSGLPTIYESGRIAANMIARKYGVVFESANRMV
ncbi:MAG: phytoene desaturase [Desulfobacteraceae bacterium]|nr:MAG: phytoene desaturase [Desulfobacteraceae bacterium]